MEIKRALTTVGTATALVVGGAGTAVAAPGGGAQVESDTVCTNFMGYEHCIAYRSVFNHTEAPSGSGNYNVTISGSQTYTITYFGQLLFSGQDSTHVSTHVRGGELQFVRVAYRGDSEFPTTCSYSYTYQVVNGELQFNKGTIGC